MKQVRIIIESDHCKKLEKILNDHTKILHRKGILPEDINIDIRLHTCGLYTGIIKYQIEIENSP